MCPHFQGIGRTCSSAFSGLLQLSVCGVEDLGVLASRHRLLSPQPFSRFLSFQDGDHPVCSSGSFGGLDGVHRFEGSLLAVSGSSRLSQVSEVCCVWPSISIPRSLFRPRLGPLGLTRFMAPDSSILHFMGICLHCYLDNWLIQSSSREAVLHDLQVVLNICREFGIVVNPEKSNFVPFQRVLYLGTVLDSRSLVASPSPDRIARLLSLGEGFLFSVQQSATCWQSLLGTLSSLTHLVPGGRLRMRSLQFQLHRNWDRVEDSTLVPWTPACRLDLLWWLDEPCLCRGVSLAQVSPDLDFWSYASDMG